MAAFGLAEGALLEPVGELWAAYSPLSGETLLLNDTGAAILEILAEGPRSPAAVVDQLSEDSGQDAGVLGPLVTDCWNALVNAGLVCPVVPPRSATASS